MVDRLYINNYKSLVDFELTNLPNFCVFAGANGTGKSNIFEALQFLAKCTPLFGVGYGNEEKANIQEYDSKNEYSFSVVENSFGGVDNLLFRNAKEEVLDLKVIIGENPIGYTFEFKNYNGLELSKVIYAPLSGYLEGDREGIVNSRNIEYLNFSKSFSRLFVDSERVVKDINTGNQKLASDASNLAKVLDRILQDSEIKEEILNWLSLLIPEFEDIKIEKGLDGDSKFYIKEKHTESWFSADLISDGTKAILALLTVVYQTDDPQFICIEEPENGLNPYVQKQMVEFFKIACENFGHTIWLNTHSQTIVKELKPEELVLIDKVEGKTVGKQFPPDFNLHGLDMDHAWLSNTLGGGVPW